MSAIAGFSRQANSLNGDSGGWVARNCGWFAEEFTQLFQQESQTDTKKEETPKPLEDRLEEIIQGALQDPAETPEDGENAEEQPPADDTETETSAAGGEQPAPDAGAEPAEDEKPPTNQPEEGT